MARFCTNCFHFKLYKKELCMLCYEDMREANRKNG